MTLLYVGDDIDDDDVVTFCDWMEIVVNISTMIMEIVVVVVDVDNVILLHNS